jgi:hypothetical protein
MKVGVARTLRPVLQRSQLPHSQRYVMSAIAATSATNVDRCFWYAPAHGSRTRNVARTVQHKHFPRRGSSSRLRSPERAVVT